MILEPASAPGNFYGKMQIPRRLLINAEPQSGPAAEWELGVENRNLCFDKAAAETRCWGASGGRQVLAGPFAAALPRARLSSSLVLRVRLD